MMVPRTAPLRLWLSAETAAELGSELGSKIADGKKTAPTRPRPHALRRRACSRQPGLPRPRRRGRATR